MLNSCLTVLIAEISLNSYFKRRENDFVWPQLDIDKTSNRANYRVVVKLTCL